MQKTKQLMTILVQNAGCQQHVDIISVLFVLQVDISRYFVKTH